MSKVTRPVMGILVPARRLNPGGLRGRVERFLQTYREEHGTVVAFSKYGIDWTKGRVKGYRFSPTRGGRGRWVRGSYPIPQAVFKDASKQGKATLNRLYEATGGRLFNHVLTSSKYVANAVMSESAELRPHVPETRRFSRESLHALLAQYGTVYVKPDKGMHGRGIFRVRSSGPGCVVAHARKSTLVPEAELYAYLARRIRNEKYIVQRAIDLARFRGHPFDIRVMVQCRGSMAWNYTGCMAKVAGRGHVVTNLERGHNRMASARTVLRSAGLPASKVIDRMCALAKEGARLLNGRVGAYASLGFDMAVDRRGHVWIIEANPRPSHALAGGGIQSRTYRRANAFIYSHLRYLATHRVGDRLPDKATLPETPSPDSTSSSGRTPA